MNEYKFLLYDAINGEKEVFLSKDAAEQFIIDQQPRVWEAYELLPLHVETVPAKARLEYKTQELRYG